jgi:putative transposase
MLAKYSKRMRFGNAGGGGKARNFGWGERTREPSAPCPPHPCSSAALPHQCEAHSRWGERPREPGPRGNSNFQTPRSTHNFLLVNLPRDDQFPQRQNPSSGVHLELDQSNIVLLTVTTEERKPWLANERAQRLLHQTWSEATAWLVGDYLLMPDHLHLFCAPRDWHFTIETWISYWKREFALKEKKLAGTPAPLKWKFQSRGWHHRLRDGENYSEKWIYVQENPVRKGLIKRIEDWRFKGRVFDLIWSGK